MSSDLKRQIAEYYLATDDLILHLRGEASTFEPVVEDFLKEDPDEASNFWTLLWRKRAELAARRLNKLRELKPPEELEPIHQSLILAFKQGLLGRQEEVRGNSVAAAEALQAAADELIRNAEMWAEYGYSPLDTFEDFLRRL